MRRSLINIKEVVWIQDGALGQLLLPERVAPAVVSGKSQLYVKNTDSILYYQNKLGNEFDVSSAMLRVVTLIG